MTPEQLEIAKAFEAVTFKPGSTDKKFADAFVATAQRSPGTELTDKQDKFVRDLAFRYRRMMPLGLVLGQYQHGYSTLQWLAPELARCGLIKNEPWVPDAARKAVSLYPNKSLHTCASILAALHPFAFDYIAQAPVLVLAVAQGSTLSKVSERKRVSREWVERFEKGGKLRDMMAMVGLAYPLRKLHPSVMESNQWETVQALCTIDASTLSQIIPAREDQKEWLEQIGRWAQHMKRRFNNRGLHFEWACRQFNPDHMRRTNQDVRRVRDHAITIADFVGTHPAMFNERWTMDRALEEANRWHEQLARANHEEKFFLENGKQWDEPIDYRPFPNQIAFDEFVFTALRSGKELFEEGRDMHHCVGSYSKDVLSGRSRIYSLINSDSEKRVATVEFSHEKSGFPVMGAGYDHALRGRENIQEIDDKRYRPTWHMVQCKGPYNGVVSKEAHAAVRKLEERLNYHAALWEHTKRNEAEFNARLERARLLPLTPVLMLKSDADALGIQAP